jgi:hypothetical protein
MPDLLGQLWRWLGLDKTYAFPARAVWLIALTVLTTVALFPARLMVRVLAIALVPCAIGLLLLTSIYRSPLNQQAVENFAWISQDQGTVNVYGTVSSLPSKEGESVFAPQAQIAFNQILFLPWIVKEIPERTTQLCVKSFTFTFLVFDRGVSGNSPRTYTPSSPDSLCKKIDAERKLVDGSLSVTWSQVEDTYSRYSYPPSYFLYPFDSLLIQIQSELIIDLIDSQGNTFQQYTVRPEHNFQFDLRGWSARGWYGPYVPERSGHNDPKSIELRRPTTTRIVIVTTILVILLAIAAIPFVETLGTAVQAAVALGLGIFGLRSFIVPNSPPGVMALDLIFVGAYILVAVAVFMQPLAHQERATRLLLTSMQAIARADRAGTARLSGILLALAKVSGDAVRRLADLLRHGFQVGSHWARGRARYVVRCLRNAKRRVGAIGRMFASWLDP